MTPLHCSAPAAASTAELDHRSPTRRSPGDRGHRRTLRPGDTAARPGTPRRTPVRWLALVAALATLVGSLAACSVRGGADDGPEATTTTDPSTEPSEPPRDRTDEVDPDQSDVPDGVFPGRGDPRIDVDHYEVEVTTTPGDPDLVGRATLTLAAVTAEPLPSFTLDLRGPEVTAVTVAGDEADVTVDDPRGELVIEPAEALEPGELVEVVVTYEGEPGTEPFPSFDIPIGWQPDVEGGWFTLAEPDGTSTWVPSNDHPSDKATWAITLDTPADVTGISNGRLASSDTADGRRRWAWEMTEPMAPHVLLAAVGHYRLDERVRPDGIRIVIAAPDDLAVDRLAGFGDLDAVIDFFAETFGEYPLADGGAVVVPSDLGLALETQSRPTFGPDALADGEVWALAHELGHEWFGNAVSPARWDDLWLSESFATYAEWLWFDHTGAADIDDLAAGAERVTGDLAVLDPEAAASFHPAIYEGGARALHALRTQVGDDAFFALVQTWYETYRGTSATTDQFFELAAEVVGDLGGEAVEAAGEDIERWADDWLRSPDQPPPP